MTGDTTVTVHLLNKDKKTLRTIQTNLDTLHKLIGVMSYGGWKPNDQVKYLVDDYHFVALEPFVVEVNLLTEAEIAKRNQEQLNAQFEGLNKEFVDRLKAPFKRNPGELN